MVRSKEFVHKNGALQNKPQPCLAKLVKLGVYLLRAAIASLGRILRVSSLVALLLVAALLLIATLIATLRRVPTLHV